MSVLQEDESMNFGDVVGLHKKFHARHIKFFRHKKKHKSPAPQPATQAAPPPCMGGMRMAMMRQIITNQQSIMANQTQIVANQGAIMANQQQLGGLYASAGFAALRNVAALDNYFGGATCP